MKKEQKTYEEPRCETVEIQSQDMIAISVADYSNDFGSERDLDS